MNDQPSIKLNFPLAVVGLMMQVVDSNGQLEESELSVRDSQLKSCLIYNPLK